MGRGNEAYLGDTTRRDKGLERQREDNGERDDRGHSNVGENGAPLVIRLQDTPSGRFLLLVVGLIVVAFVAGGLRVWHQTVEINNAQARIDRIIDDQSPLTFAFDNVNATSGNRVTFEVVCERSQEGAKYNCVTKQTSPVVAELTPVPTTTPRAP